MGYMADAGGGFPLYLKPSGVTMLSTSARFAGDPMGSMQDIDSHPEA